MPTPRYNAYYYRVWCDGGQNLKNKNGYGGFVVQHAGKILERQKTVFGKVESNAHAEYLALNMALEWVFVNIPPRVVCVIHCDNQSMVNQIKGKAQVLNPTLLPLYEDAIFQLKRIPGARLSWVARKEIVLMLGF